MPPLYKLAGGAYVPAVMQLLAAVADASMRCSNRGFCGLRQCPPVAFAMSWRARGRLMDLPTVKAETAAWRLCGQRRFCCPPGYSNRRRAQPLSGSCAAARHLHSRHSAAQGPERWC